MSLVQFLTYKAAWASGEIVTHDRWFASSKTCHVCGKKNKSLKLSDRLWICIRCKVVHDRDYRAGTRCTTNVVKQSAPEKFIQGTLFLVTDEAPIKGSPLQAWVAHSDSVNAEVRHFLECIQNGDEPITSGRDNLGTMAVVEAIYRAAETKSVVRVEQVN